MSKTKGQKAYLERESQNSFNPKDKRQLLCESRISAASSAVKQAGAFPQGSKQTKQQVYVFTFLQ